MFQRIVKYYKSVRRLNLLFFINGILFGLLIYFYSEDSYEDRLFKALASDVKKQSYTGSNISDSTFLVNSLHLVHRSLEDRQGLFSDIGGLKGGLIQPLTVDLMTGQGACGSYALVLARLVNELGYETRMVQMEVNNEPAGHILIEAKYKDKWIVLDPSYDHYFRHSNGTIASFTDIQSDWNYYQNQVPPNYDLRYKYEGKQYTNWNKIPVLMPAIKKVLDWTIGKENADTLSLRILVLRKFHVFFIITLVIQLLLISYMIYYIYRRQKPSVSNRKATEKEAGKVTVKVVNAEKSIDHVDN